MAKGSPMSFLISTPVLLCSPPVPIRDLGHQGARVRGGGSPAVPLHRAREKASPASLRRRNSMHRPSAHRAAAGTRGSAGLPPGLPRAEGAGEARAPSPQPSTPPPPRRALYLGRRRRPSDPSRRGLGSQLSCSLRPGGPAPLSPPQPSAAAEVAAAPWSRSVGAAAPWAPSGIGARRAVGSRLAGGDLRLPGSLGGEGGAAADLAGLTGQASRAPLFPSPLCPLPWF